MTATRSAAVLLCCLLLASCSGGKSATPYAGTARLARALNANGVECKDLAATKGAPATEGAAAQVSKGATRLAQQAGTCSHGGGKLLLFTFKSTSRRNRWLALGRLYGPVVVGPNWTVSTASKDLADQISGALGGDVR